MGKTWSMRVRSRSDPWENQWCWQRTQITNNNCLSKLKITLFQPSQISNCINGKWHDFVHLTSTQASSNDTQSEISQVIAHFLILSDLDKYSKYSINCFQLLSRVQLGLVKRVDQTSCLQVYPWLMKKKKHNNFLH